MKDFSAATSPLSPSPFTDCNTFISTWALIQYNKLRKWQQKTSTSRIIHPKLSFNHEKQQVLSFRSMECPSLSLHFTLNTGSYNTVLSVLLCCDIITHTHERTHILLPFIRDYPGELVLEGKTNLYFTEARDSEWQWYQLATSLQTDNHASTQPLKFLQACCPTNSVKALKAKHCVIIKMHNKTLISAKTVVKIK